jgi:threonyl-tRNA synthetase
MIVIGEKEESIGMVSVRSKAQGDIGRMKLAEFADKIKSEVEKKVR